MTKSNTIVSFCANRITPIAAALVLAVTGGQALATGPGADALNGKLLPRYIPTLKTPPGILKAKSADLLLALSLALQDSANSGIATKDIVEEVLKEIGGKARADRSKIAGQVLATAIAARNVTDPTELASITTAVFNVNSTNPKTKLTSAGQGLTLAASIKAASTAGAESVGTSISAAFTPATPTVLTQLLTDTSKGLGTSTLAASQSYQHFIKTLLAGEVPSNTEAFVKTSAEKVAATNPAAAGAYFGGLVLDNPGSAYDSNTELQTLATNALSDAKLAKAFGEILATTMITFGTHVGDTADKGDLTAALTSPSATVKTEATRALVTQGILRAGTTADVVDILDHAGAITDAAKFGGVAAVGTGNDPTKLSAISTKLSANVTDPKKKQALGLALVGAVGAATPAAAEVIPASLGLTTDSDRIAFGTAILSKIKAYSAAGYVASGIVKLSANQTPDNNASTAALFIVTGKASKAATDIAHQVGALTSSSNGGGLISFTDRLSDQAKAAVQSIAVGVSLANPAQSGAITVAAITHDALDKAAPAKAATIGGAVATAVDEEQAANVAQAIANSMSDGGTASGRPIKNSLITALATSLAKAVQTKSSVTLFNRMDELGEIAGALTSGLIGQTTTDLNRQKLITSVGSAILKSLSKVARLSANPNEATTDGTASALVTKVSTLSADLWEARDIAGSIAQTIKASTLTAAQQAALLGTGTDTAAAQGPLLSAFLKLAGKKGSATYNAVIQAFVDVRAGNGGGKFETGNDFEPFKETDNKNG